MSERLISNRHPSSFYRRIAVLGFLPLAFVLVGLRAEDSKSPTRSANPSATVAAVVADDAAAKGAIPWKGGAFATARKSAAEIATVVNGVLQNGQRHFVAQFAQPLTDAERKQLEAAGVRLLAYLSDNAFFAAATNQLTAAALAQVPNLVYADTVMTSWKLHPSLLAGQVFPWMIVGERKDTRSDLEIEKNGETPPPPPANPTVGIYVLFHPDVSLAAEGMPLAMQYGALVRSTLETVNGLVLELPYDNILALASEDAVQWIEPPLPKMAANNDSNRARVGANIVQAAPYNLSGAGVTVLVYDAGTALTTHADFGGRLTAHDSSGLIDHATHVSGTIGGSGAASGGTFKGMAPGVTIVSYGFEQEGGLHQGFLYTDPGDIQADYNQAVNTFGADIANNSIGTNTAGNGFPCDWEGDYGVTDTVIDNIVRGSLGAPFRIVWANGNERGAGSCGTAYHTTAPPACAKNHITVGALNSNDDSMTSFSSWGPADDGRLKPDVSAPGCQSDGDAGVTSCSASGGYTVFCGTSMASPTTCGLGALLLQDFRAHYPAQPDPRNSTLKVLLAHTALDLGNTGPDYQFGYGSVRIQPAVDFLRTGNFIENQVGQGQTYSVLVVVNPTDTQLKVTLAWDDPIGTPNVSPALVNDLDLRVFDSSNNQYFPWTLNPNSPATPAVRTQADHANNIEQIVIDNPAPGAYRVEVVGFNVPQGPQPFSLGASPLLVNCSHQGVISLDRAKYPCGGNTTIQVVDCDLNTSDSVIDTVAVTIASTSEPAGETIVLTETSAETALFRGTIPLNTSNSGGVLQIAHGDTLTATYVDADDGQGGHNVVVTSNATVDCVAPIITNVQTANLRPRSVNVTFTTDETAQGTVRYGTSCGALSQSAVELGSGTTHTISLSGLTPDTAYSFAVDATDTASNAATNDNGGACFTFHTPPVPNFLTESFDANDNDLHHRFLLFTPDGSISYYDACSHTANSLPTDPVGGTVLSPADDDPRQVTLGGGATVSLYGVSYNNFWVSPNGYITFGTSDSDYSESLTDHFRLPRISALFDDFNPLAGGSVSWKQTADRVAVTWQNVPEYNTTNQNTFQIEMYFDGRIRITYLALAALDGLAGLSDGSGLSADYAEEDLSAQGSCGPQPPQADPVAVTTRKNLPVTFDLSATDDGLPLPQLTYIVTSLPAHGTLTDYETSAPITSVPYALANNGKKLAFLPQNGYGGADSFQYKANDGGSFPTGGDSNLAVVSLTMGGKGPIHSFPMDTNPGWTTTGQWAFGVPTGTGSNNPDPTGGYTGANVYGYNLNGDYPNNLSPTQYLTTTALNCSGQTGCELRFRRWLGVESSSYDHANIQASNNGTTWTTIWNHDGGSFGETSWSYQTYDIAAVADNKSAVRIRWGMGVTDVSVTYSGWNIDDVEIWASLPPAILGDLNCDGVVDFFDIDAFVLAITDPDGYAAQYPGCEINQADINGDGRVDFFDIDPFIDLIT